MFDPPTEPSDNDLYAATDSVVNYVRKLEAENERLKAENDKLAEKVESYINYVKFISESGGD